MSRTRTILVTLATFILGIVAGGGAVIWAYNEFLLQPIAISTPTAEAATNLAVLRAVREGRPDKAISSLETYLDGNLISLSAFPDGRLDNQTIAVIRRVAAYREAYPYTSSEPVVAQRVTQLLSKYKAGTSEQK